MKIKLPKIVGVGSNIEYRADIEFENSHKTLWYRLEEEYASLVSPRSDAALLAMLIPAMAEGEDIYVEGDVSPRLYYNLARPFQYLLQSLLPELQIVNVEVEALAKPSERPEGVATGFSAGVDSFAVVADHYFSDVPDSFRLTHLLFNNVGQAGESKKLFRRRLQWVKRAALDLGLPVVSVNSNLDSFYEPYWRYNYNKTYTFRNSSVALLLQGGIGRVYFASGLQYDVMHLDRPFDASVSDAATFPMMATETTDLVLTGSEYSRIEKMLKLVGLKETHNSLNVCVVDAENCSRCRKCLRTLLTFEVAGHLDAYKEVFDLELYRRERNRYIAKLLVSDFVFDVKLRQYMRKRGFSIPWESWFYLPFYVIFPAKQVKRLKRLILKKLSALA